MANTPSKEEKKRLKEQWKAVENTRAAASTSTNYTATSNPSGSIPKHILDALQPYKKLDSQLCRVCGYNGHMGVVEEKRKTNQLWFASAGLVVVAYAIQKLVQWLNLCDNSILCSLNDGEFKVGWYGIMLVVAIIGVAINLYVFATRASVTKWFCPGHKGEIE